MLRVSKLTMDLSQYNIMIENSSFYLVSELTNILKLLEFDRLRIYYGNRANKNLLLTDWFFLRNLCII